MFKVGDRVEDQAGDRAEVLEVRRDDIRLRYDSEEFDQGRWFYPSKFFKLADEEPEGPIRTVTRKEIVEGTYGPVVVTAAAITATVRRDRICPHKLREAISTLLTLADALE